MRHVLIVDDKPDNLLYLDALLTGNGYRVQSAQHGAEALVMARTEPPDLIIADLLMPVMDGYTLLRHWKSDARLMRVPFVVYTATHTEPEDERLALSLGADAFLVKPMEPEALLQRIRELEAAHREGRDIRTPMSLEEEPDLLKIYSQTLVRKLEEKTLLLEQSNQSLQQEIAERRRMIDAQTATLDALRESEERFRQLAESISEVFWISGVNKPRILYVSPAYSKIWGRTPEDLYAAPESWLACIHPDDREQVRLALPLQERGEYDVTYRVVRPDESIRWVRDRAFPVRDAADAVVRVVGIAQDITEQRSVEAQMLRAQRLESIGTLAGGIAHDLNNVLTPILMSIELLRLDLDEEERGETLTSIEKSALKGADMVRQVLSFARGVEGRREAVELADLIRDTEMIVRDTFLKSIDVRTNVDRNVPTVLGDATQLHQVLLNLCVNARDAMPHGGTITISASRRVVDEARVRAHAGVRPGDFVAVEVRDNGTGMSPNIMERIFDPFFTTKDVGRGTGIGLSTSLSIVQSHGGFIEVRSTVGDGSAFIVYLPMSADRLAALEIEPVPRLPRGAGELVLVADDEASIRDISSRTLEAFGYRVLLAADGAEAVAMFAKHAAEIAAVVSDLMMPGVDGATAIRAIRGLAPTVPVIVVSGLEAGAESVNVLRSIPGPLYRLSKPYRAEEFLTLLHDVLHPTV